MHVHHASCRRVELHLLDLQHAVELHPSAQWLLHSLLQTLGIGSLVMSVKFLNHQKDHLRVQLYVRVRYLVFSLINLIHIDLACSGLPLNVLHCSDGKVNSAAVYNSCNSNFCPTFLNYLYSFCTCEMVIHMKLFGYT